MRSRHPPSPAAAPPLEDDNLLAEILLRLPPQPSSLPRASAVCKRWHGLASDPGFSRRFRIHHRDKPPLLGFFLSEKRLRRLSFVPTLKAPNSVPAGRFSLQFDHEDFRLLNSRHGLVLVLQEQRRQILLWDPVTGDKHHIALPPGFPRGPGTHGAVLRAAGDTKHFQVVLLVAEVYGPQPSRVLACVYLSEIGAWSDIISTPIPPGVPVSNRAIDAYLAKPAVLAENSLYWMLAGGLVAILEFDLESKSIAVIQPPVDVFTQGELAVVRAEGGALGFLFVSNSDLSAKLWKRSTDGVGASSWMLGRTIEFGKLLSLNTAEERGQIWTLGFAEDNNVVVLRTDSGVFMIHLESLQFKRLPNSNMITIYHPFERVHAAGRDGGSGVLVDTTG